MTTTLAVTEAIDSIRKNDFSLFAHPQNELYQVLQILKRIGNVMP
jgi:hypothetical protein